MHDPKMDTLIGLMSQMLVKLDSLAAPAAASDEEAFAFESVPAKRWQERLFKKHFPDAHDLLEAGLAFREKVLEVFPQSVIYIRDNRFERQEDGTQVERDDWDPDNMERRVVRWKPFAREGQTYRNVSAHVLERLLSGELPNPRAHDLYSADDADTLRAKKTRVKSPAKGTTKLDDDIPF